MSFGDEFQRLSKYLRESLKGKGLDWGNKPSLYKKYSGAKETAELPGAECEGGKPLYQTIQQRRSVRNYQDTAVDGKTLSQVLWAA